MKFRVLLFALVLSLAYASAATYPAGSIVSNFTMIARHPFTNHAGQMFASNAPVQLSDFAGRIVFLEFFAVW